MSAKYAYHRRPCSDFMDMLRRLISCRIIIIIIIIDTTIDNDITDRSSGF